MICPDCGKNELIAEKRKNGIVAYDCICCSYYRIEQDGKFVCEPLLLFPLKEPDHKE